MGAPAGGEPGSAYLRTMEVFPTQDSPAITIFTSSGAFPPHPCPSPAMAGAECRPGRGGGRSAAGRPAVRERAPPPPAGCVCGGAGGRRLGRGAGAGAGHHLRRRLRGGRRNPPRTGGAGRTEPRMLLWSAGLRGSEVGFLHRFSRVKRLSAAFLQSDGTLPSLRQPKFCARAIANTKPVKP